MIASTLHLAFFRPTRCSFSLECRERQILRGLGLAALVTLLLAAHLQSANNFTSPLVGEVAQAQPGRERGNFNDTPHRFDASGVSAASPTRGEANIKFAPTLPAHWSIESGSIQGAFSRSAQHAGLTKTETTSLSQIFSNQIDFKHLRAGTSFKVVTERVPAHADNIIAASFTSQGKTTTAIRFADTQGHVNYYQPNGASLSPGFLRYPAHYTRIGSGFTLHRLDPVTGEYHSHPAIDFDAPLGTPITATGDGKISAMDFEQGYGNVVRIHHAGNILTLYAHMRNFAKGLHAGSDVKKGEIIGYVGMTGYATGPHVHYEIHFGSKPVNPLTTTLPNASSLPKNQQAKFNQALSEVKRLI